MQRENERGLRLETEEAAAKLKQRIVELEAAATRSTSMAALFSTEAEKLKGKLAKAAAKVKSTSTEADLEAAQKQVIELIESKEQAPKRPRSNTTQDFESMDYAGQATARHRAIKYAESLLDDFSWRGKDLATILKRKGLIEDVWESKELWTLRMEWARELFGQMMSFHWDVKLPGLYLTFTKHMLPTRLVRRVAQAAPMDFSGETNSFHPRILLISPHLHYNVLTVSRILPASSKFANELVDLTDQHGLYRYLPEWPHRLPEHRSSHHRRCPRDLRAARLCYLSDFTRDFPLELVVQLDAARRRTRQFLPVVIKNPQIDSKSFLVLHLLCFAVRLKDDRNGVQRVLAPHLKVIESILQSGW
eukprot:6206852-Pleurochrysis_carterae.AAC.1